MVEGKETMEVEETRCDTALRPFEINYCRLACPGHCVVTNWSTWSRCTQVITPDLLISFIIYLLIFVIDYHIYFYANNITKGVIPVIWQVTLHNSEMGFI